MSRYVDVEPLDVVGTKGVSKDYADGMAYVLDLLDNLPIADVELVRHGKWSHDYIKDGMEYNDWFNLHCSVCGETQREAWGKWKYCPYCGAIMDKEERENE